ncbi:hypothetical protein F5J12DRAFT_786351 [Pisolithus orientalis]|uniref:uncharacterized protein n=1 Tax=Pisolithus orientalis TaxID=936130 RepID=UPI0022250E33|nr:uncharacterized protein F5J12DRAFT_786351 [Pisolithus orientalis]KAI5991273.1 hypothetical protein F5J12DRAFT_786351 [Pisolithus orientalis]
MDIMANSCESLLDQFLQEREPTALAEGGIAALDSMNMDLLEQLLNAQEPSALPVMHEKLNRMDGSSTPAQDVTMQDMREPMPPPLVSNVNFHLHSNLFKWNNGDWHLFCIAIKSCVPYMPWHLAWAVNAIARELGTAARDQYGAASQGLQLSQYAQFDGRWPTHWLANLAMDLCSMPVILLPSWHATSAYLRHQDDELIPLSTFSIINNISAIVLHWTPHAADPNSGFAFPWWLYHSKEYAVDSQRLQGQGKGLFSAAWDFFKLMMAQGLWPLPEAPITDCLDGHIEEQVNYCIENIWKYADVVNSQGQQIDHFYARWWALHGLLGMLLQ